MDWYTRYKLVKDGDGYTLEIYLNKDSTEFADEYMSDKEKDVSKLDDKVKKLIKDKFSNLKINSAKIIIGTVIVATIPFFMGTTVAAAEPTSTTSVQQSVYQSEINTIGTVTASQLNVRSGPATSYSIIHVLWNGNQVKVIDESGSWYNIKLSDGSTGWVSKSYLKIQANTTGTVTASTLNVRTGPSTSYSIMSTLWKGNQVKIISESGDWYHIGLSDGRTGWVSKAYLQITQTQQKIDTVISTAKSLIGTPYVWGGESLQEGGFDCSGFTQYVFKQAGYSLNRISLEQANQGLYVSYSNIQPGDLVFFSFNQDGKVDHVGIYIGNGQMIHSPKTGDTVKITDINVTYWQQRYVTARRIIY